MTADAHRERLRANLDRASIEPGRHWYRVLAPDGKLWCETSNPREAADRVPDGYRLEILHTYIVRTPWEPWTPSPEDLAAVPDEVKAQAAGYAQARAEALASKEAA